MFIVHQILQLVEETMTKAFTPPDSDYANSGWIQALMGANDPVLQQSRLFFKKQLDSVDTLSNLSVIREKADNLSEIIDALWKFANENELQWLLNTVPSLQLEWQLDGVDLFTIEQKSVPEVSDVKQWAGALGLTDWTVQVIMRILSSDFVSWQRKVARTGSDAPIGFTMQTSTKSMLELKTTASWKANRWADGVWTFSIDGQPNMEYHVEESVYVPRPSIEHLLDNAILHLHGAEERFAKRRTKDALQLVPNDDWKSFRGSVTELEAVHTLVMESKDLSLTAPFRYIWSTIWPVLYCRRKRLKRGVCSVVDLRKRLDMCFRAEPQTATWIAVFGELLLQNVVGDGLGICAKYSKE